MQRPNGQNQRLSSWAINYENDDLPLSWKAAWGRCTQSDVLQGSSTKLLLLAGHDEDEDDDADDVSDGKADNLQ